MRIKTFFRFKILFNIFIVFLMPVFLYPAQQKCLICHGKLGFKKVKETGKVKRLYVDTEKLNNSVHKDKKCTDCHYNVESIPHQDTPGRVNCQHCHYRGNPEGAPETDKYIAYEKSVHGKEVKKGNPDAPVCQDCHGNHNIKPVKSPKANTAHSKVAETCGKCHMKQYNAYMNSTHGIAVYEEGSEEAPDCTGCHGEHSIESSESPESKVFASNISHTCSDCHSVEGIVGKYGIKTEQVKTYEESFHGIATKYGSKTVANCASCHGNHKILPPSNPRSSVHPDNIPQTCGKENCHPGANANYAKGKIHVDPASREAGIIYYVATFFKYLTITVMIGLILHILFDFYRKSRKGRPEE